jgi:hypothetical protein
MTTDIEGAKKFYGSLFGWGLEEWQAPGMDVPYTVTNVDGEPQGGMMLKPAECGAPQPFWGVYITVDDVDETAKQAKDLGGTVLMEPRDIPEVGRFCVIQDPQGGVLSAITYINKECD